MTDDQNERMIAGPPVDFLSKFGRFGKLLISSTPERETLSPPLPTARISSSADIFEVRYANHSVYSFYKSRLI